MSTPPVPCGYKYPNFNKICTRLWEVSKEITVAIVNEIKNMEFPLEQSTFYGDAVFPKGDRNDEPYKPEVVRELIEFRNCYTPIYLQATKEHWQRETCGKTLIDYWIDCHGPLREYRDGNKTVELSGNRPVDTFTDNVPVLPKTYEWMY